jgi:adenylate cyclase
MTEIVFANKGTLDKYMGDAVMAFFGAPVKYSDHAKMACRCALKSIEKLYELQKVFEKQGLPHIDIGIGINTGEMSVGNMGSNIVQNYTVMGDSVNLGSRLEGINKEYGTRIIISEFTHEDVKDAFTAREIDRVRVKGKYEPVKIFELVCEGKAPPDKATLLTLFNQAYDLYLQKKFTDALVIFKQALETSQNDPVSKLYIERCEDYIETPPPENWDGVYVMKTK